MKKSKLIALDADGVLLDYNSAYAAAWERAFGVRPQLRDANAYWAVDRWGVDILQGPALQQFRASLGESFWAAIPAIAGAVQACEKLVSAGYELICVSALQPAFAKARQSNLHQLGFPIERVVATSNHSEQGESPKAAALRQLQPAAFVDDFLPYFAGVPKSIHTALILRDPVGSPNTGPGLQSIDSTHANLHAFVQWWLEPQS